METDELWNQPDYVEAVDRGRDIVTYLIKAYQYELGQLTNQIDTKYGEQSLGQYATDIGIDYETLKRYRTTDKAWKNTEISDRPPYAIARELSRHPSKEQVWEEIKDTKSESVGGAKTIMKEWRERNGKPGRNFMTSKVIVKNINKFLAEDDYLKEMILVVPRGPRETDAIVEALLDAARRIREVMDSLQVVFEQTSSDFPYGS